VKVEDCLKEGLLAKAMPSLEKARSSVRMAEHKLELALKELKHEIFENAVVSAYASMFHSARALLFKDGFKERSHFAVFVYVNEKYSGRIERKYINELNSLRLQRHDLMYGLEKSAEIQKTEAESAIQMAKGFLESIKKILQEKS